LLPSVIQDEINCDPRLRMIEWHLRVAQAEEALAKIRDSLRIKSVLAKFKIDHTHGVREGNRSTERIKDSLKKAQTHAMTYRAARRALSQLAVVISPHKETENWERRYPKLTDDDIKPLPVDAFQLGQGYELPELTWIWKAYRSGLGSDQNREEMDDGADLLLDSDGILLTF
jgi:hypothetical protein